MAPLLRPVVPLVYRMTQIVCRTMRNLRPVAALDCALEQAAAAVVVEVKTWRCRPGWHLADPVEMFATAHENGGFGIAEEIVSSALW